MFRITQTRRVVSTILNSNKIKIRCKTNLVNSSGINSSPSLLTPRTNTLYGRILFRPIDARIISTRSINKYKVMNPYNTTGTIIRANKSENTTKIAESTSTSTTTDSIPIIIPTTPITIITTEVPDVSDTTVPVDSMQQTLSPPQVTRAKSFLMFVDKLDQHILRLLFGPSMQMPPCPFKPPSMWGSGWKLYLKIALWAMPSTIVLYMASGLGIYIIIIIVGYALIGLKALCDWIENTLNKFLPPSETLNTNNDEVMYDYKTRKNNLKETPEQIRKRHLLQMRLITAGVGVAGFIPISMLILDIFEMKTRYKTMTACKFATHLGRSGISLSCGLGLFYLFGLMLVEDPLIKGDLTVPF